MMTGCPAPRDNGVAPQQPPCPTVTFGCLNTFPNPRVGVGGGHSNPNLFHLLLQGIQGVSPGQQLLQAAQLPLLLFQVLLLLLPLLLQRRELGFVAADGVWWGRKGRAVSALAPPVGEWGLSITDVLAL